MKPIRLISTLLSALLLSTTLAFAADWHSGKLMDTEKQEVPTGSTDPKAQHVFLSTSRPVGTWRITLRWL
jgi:hypothetical protein